MRKSSKPAPDSEERRAEGSPDNPAPNASSADGAEPRRKRRHGKRRGPKTEDPSQGSLFESEPAKSRRDGGASGEPEEGAPESEGGEGKKSRSKRRRDRRKAAMKAKSEDAPQEAAPRQAQPKEAGRRKQPQERDPERRSEGRSRRAETPRGKARKGAQAPARQGGRRRQDAAPGRGGRIEGLPPFSAEDLAAVSLSPRSGGDRRYAGSGGRSGGGRGGRGAPAPIESFPREAARRLETLIPSSESMKALDALESVLDEAAPLQAKHRAALKGDIRSLWEELTSDRESRSEEYLGTPAALSAYLRYFMPWNVFRLTSLLTNADFCLPDGAVVADVGSGPLTLPIALWASRPELREVPLTIYCMDRVERVLDAGIAVFETLCMRVGGRLPPWKIVSRKDSFGAPLPERAHLLAAANVFNEFFWKDRRSLGEKAIDTARTLLSYTRENGSLFVMEPGDPRSGSLISALRAALIAEGASPLGPCPHSLSCPMPGIFKHLLPPEETRTVKGDPNAAPSRFVLPQVVMPKKRDKYPWCHLGIDAVEAPAWLERLSEEAGLPKERAVLSYLWAARGAAARPAPGMPDSVPGERERRARAGRGILVRVVSESFPLPDGSTGQYACSSLGYTLLKRKVGEKGFASGDLLEVAVSPLPRPDEKSGAIILPT